MIPNIEINREIIRSLLFFINFNYNLGLNKGLESFNKVLNLIFLWLQRNLVIKKDLT